MAKSAWIRVMMATAFVLAGSVAPVGATAVVGPALNILLSRESSAYEAWKSRSAGFWDSFLANEFVGWSSAGRLDKASATKEYTGADCEIASYGLSDPQMTVLGRDVALITHKVTVSGTCGGQKIPANSWAATVYARHDNQWKAAFHAEAAIVDPAALVMKATQVGSEHGRTVSADRTGGADTLLRLETAIWEAWKDHDAKRLDGLTATNMQFINIFGAHLATKGEALKNWSGEGCDVKTVSLTDAAATMLSPTVGILTFRASADGTCFGQNVGPIWGSSIYVKDGDTWKWHFGINVPAG